MKYFCSSCGKPTIYNLNMPKFCSECGASFASKVTTTSNLKKLFPSENFKPVEAKPLSPEQNERINATVEKMTPKYKANISFENNANEQQTPANEDVDYIDSEDFDTSKFKYIKPQFRVEARKNDSVSFENLVTHGYANNHKPSTESFDSDATSSHRSADDVLSDFMREASSLRNSKE